MYSLGEIIEKWYEALENTVHCEKAVCRQAELWDKAAASYDDSMGKDYKRLNACVRALDSRNMIDSTVDAADIGCGTGELSLLLSPHVKQVYAIDESGAMLDVMKSKMNTGYSNITLLTKDFNSIINSNYDLVIASYNPATYTPDAFEKYLEMGNVGGLFSVSSAKTVNKKRDMLKRELFGKSNDQNTGMRIEYPYEYLKILGLKPEISYSKSGYTHMQPVKDVIEHYQALFPLMNNYPENGDEIIEKFVMRNSHNGMFCEEVEFSTGIITWFK